MKKLSLLLCSLLVSVFFVVACNHSKGKGGSEKIDDTPGLTPEGVTVDEAEAIIKEHKGDTNFVILDVRTKAEFKEGYLVGHLEESPEHPYRGVINHDRYAPDFEDFLSKLDKNKRYLMHCRTDVRSKYTFDILKKKKFKKIQYIIGGYTAWSDNKKPTENPPYDKVVDVQITGDKIKTNSDITFKFYVTDLDDDPLRKAALSLQVFSGNNEVEKQDIKSDNDGRATYTFNAASRPKGLYRLVCNAKHKTVHEEFKPVEAYYYFEVADEDEGVSGSASEIKLEAEIDSKMTEKFYNRNIYGYKVYDRERNIIPVGKSVEASKPTLMIFISPLCTGCMVKAQELDKYNLSNINFIPVLISIDEEDLENEIATNEKLLKDNFQLDSMIPIAVYDAKDKIFNTRIKFKTTPKFVLINKEGQIKDIIHNSESLQTTTLLNRMETLFKLPAFTKK